MQELLQEPIHLVSVELTEPRRAVRVWKIQRTRSTNTSLIGSVGSIFKFKNYEGIAFLYFIVSLIKINSARQPTPMDSIFLLLPYSMQIREADPELMMKKEGTYRGLVRALRTNFILLMGSGGCHCARSLRVGDNSEPE